MTKLRHLEPYGFNEQPQFNGLANTVKANIESIKEKNQEQDKKDEEQDANITQVTSALTNSLNQKLGSGFTGDNSANTVTSVIENTASALNDLNDRKADTSALTAHIGDNVKHITAEERTKWNGKISNAEYNGTEKKIYFYSGATKENPVSTIDATNFIKDGMVKQVEIKEVESSGSCLVITFNADAGNEVITIPVSKIFDSGKYYSKTETSGATELNTAFNSKANKTDLDTHISDKIKHITADERTKWNNADTNSHTHGNKAILDTITAIDTELSATSNNLVVNSAITKVIVENEKVVSAALNDLNDRKLDASAYTQSDLSDYYKKGETSGATEITNALNAKANTGHTHSSNDITDKVTEITNSNSDSTSVPTVKAVMQVITQLQATIATYENRIKALEDKDKNNSNASQS